MYIIPIMPKPKKNGKLILIEKSVYSQLKEAVGKLQARNPTFRVTNSFALGLALKKLKEAGYNGK